MPQKQKKSKRPPRACDSCRVKRIRCGHDGDLEKPCNPCVELQVECTFLKDAPKKYESRKEYIEFLENRLAKMEKLFTKFNSDALPAEEIHETTADLLEMSSTSPETPFPISILRTKSLNSSIFQDDLNGSARVPSVPTQSASTYWGKSGMTGLIGITSNLMKEGWSSVITRLPSVVPPMPWENISFVALSDPYDFPSNETVSILVDIYFTHINVYWPLLCRPLIEKDIAQGIHFFDLGFARTLFLICALASRCAHHPNTYSVPDEPRSCGWQWFHAAQSMQPSFLQQPSLADIQFYALSALFVFLFGSMDPLTESTLISTAVRQLQILGMHRKCSYTRSFSASDELWKRAFWILVAMDRTINMFRGHPSIIEDETFDIDMPLECDDEYWDLYDEDHAVRQPEDKPPKVSYFCAYLRLLQVNTATLRTLYSTNQSRVFYGISSDQWEQTIVPELESALNRWLETVPHHLRWDANRPPGVLRDLSMVLQASYQYTRIAIHQPFIQKSTHYPSLAICTHAAQACIGLVQAPSAISVAVQHRLVIPLFSSALLMFINLLSTTHSLGVTLELEAMIGRCIEAIKSFEVLPVAFAAWHTLDLALEATSRSRAESGALIWPHPINANQTVDAVITEGTTGVFQPSEPFNALDGFDPLQIEALTDLGSLDSNGLFM